MQIACHNYQSGRSLPRSLDPTTTTRVTCEIFVNPMRFLDEGVLPFAD